MVVRKRIRVQGPALVFITTTVKDWTPVFANENAAKCIIEQLTETTKFYDSSLAGYVLMPTHLHMLLGLPDLLLLSNFMEAFKSLSSRKIKKLGLKELNNNSETHGSFQLWTPRFDDIVITSERQFMIKLNYIHNNPVRAGLVVKANDWIYSSANDWLECMPGIMPIDKKFRWTEQ